ncbi:O-antigen ligase family protein [Niabella ginsengisoli]|uniref:O-antigen ligase family protein n=1 Tax=Niabella ginsengisoli TaxID=522298 RepID=A0ABS9SHP9_9BACT|nr:O-antigen ligase family protein [Niabella ginsengisoli]MCH5597903.1 O-antigen ligase family protein [Niabella ginsengisoli]
MYQLSTGYRKLTKRGYIILSLALLLSIISGIAAFATNLFFVPFIPVIIVGLVIFVILLFREPFIGLVSVFIYCFFLFVFSREINDEIQFGLGTEALLILTWLSVWYNAKRFDFSVLTNKLTILCLIWFIISVIQLVNPAGASPTGWLQEIRSTALLPLLLAPLGMILITTNKRLNTIIYIMIVCSFLGILNGIKQKYLGLSPGEQRFLDDGGSITHVVSGQLRVFSFYSHAGQFGPSQAQLSVACAVLAIGLKKWGRKVILVVLSLLFFYGMLISGTRGSFFALIAAAGSAVFFARKFKIIILGVLALGFFIGILKYTNIGSSNYNIYRLRTAVDPDDPSLKVRFESQRVLADYMKSRPFGGGLGVIGTFGHKYNSDKFLSTIEPDSYWVKIWVMYGIIGMIIWFSIMMYLIGKCFGIIWTVKEKSLNTKLIALGSGIIGLFVCSYGNEVMNDIPSSLIVWLSFGAIFNAHKIENSITKSENINKEIA